MEKFYGNIKAGSRNISIPALLRSAIDNSEITGKVAANIIAAYWRQGAIPIVIPATDLPSVNSPFLTGGWKEVDSVNQPGLYRLDIPDESVAIDSDWVIISISTGGSYVFYERYNLRSTSLVESEIFDSILTNSYMTIPDAQDYFDTKLNTESWEESTNESKVKALIEATRIIDSLNFAGNKSKVDQILQFPRNGDIFIPNDIRLASCEIALRLLDGVDPEEEIESSAVEQMSYSSVRSSFNRNYIAPHIMAGVPSIVAWKYLYPYLREPNQLALSRIN